MSVAASKLAILARHAPEQLPRVIGGEDWHRRRSIAFLSAGVVAVAAIVGTILTNVWYEPLDGWELFVATLPFSLSLFALYLVGSIFLLRGRSNSHLEWIGAAAVSLFAFPAAGFGLGGTVNGLLDGAPEVVHEARVVGHHSVSGKSRSYYVHLASWRDTAAEEIEVNSGFYDRAAVGRTVAITTRPGHFG